MRLWAVLIIKKQPTVPEIGICLDFLHHMAINKDGEVSICVRFDPERFGVIGNAKETSPAEMWWCEKNGMVTIS